MPACNNVLTIQNNNNQYKNKLLQYKIKYWKRHMKCTASDGRIDM